MDQPNNGNWVGGAVWVGWHSDGLLSRWFFHHQGQNGQAVCFLYHQVFRKSVTGFFSHFCRSQHWQLTQCSDWRQLNNENEAESTLELAHDEVSEDHLCFHQGLWNMSFGQKLDNIFMANKSHQVIGAMKSNLPAGSSDRIFHTKVCKLHWRMASNVAGVTDILIHLISIFILRRNNSVSSCSTSNQWACCDSAS